MIADQRQRVYLYNRINTDWVPFDAPHPDDYRLMTPNGIPLDQFDTQLKLGSLISQIGSFFYTSGTPGHFMHPGDFELVSEAKNEEGFATRTQRVPFIMSGDLFVFDRIQPETAEMRNPLYATYCVLWVDASAAELFRQDDHNLILFRCPGSDSNLNLWVPAPRHLKEHNLSKLWKH